MAIKLLESLPSGENEVAQQIDDGALMNFQAAHQTNGALWGCNLTNTTSGIYISEGLLMVRGFRFKIDGTTQIKNFLSMYPSTVVTWYLYLQVTRSGNNATFQWAHTPLNVAPSLANIEREPGSYFYKVCSFNIGPNGIVGNVTPLIGKITAGGTVPSSGGGETVSSLPAPRLELVSSTANGTRGMTKGYLCLANRSDYTKFTSIYTIRFVLLRHVTKGRYRHRQGTNRLRTSKTGFVKPISYVGWRGISGTPHMKQLFTYTELLTETLDTRGTYKYVRSDIIDPIENYIDVAFYYSNPITKAKEQVIPGMGQERGYIRAIRSKRIGEKRSYVHKHNFFKFAFRAELYDSNSKLVAVSDPGTIVTILVNRSVPDKLTGDGGYGDLFRIRVE